MLKIFLYAICSYSISVIFFSTSILAMVFIFTYLISIDRNLRNNSIKKNKRSFFCKLFILLVCLIGFILIFFGAKVIKQDMYIIIGAILFSSTFTYLLVMEFSNVVKRIKIKFKGGF